MKIYFRILSFVFCCVVFSVSCTNAVDNTGASGVAADSTDFATLVADWNAAHNTKTKAALTPLYSTPILFYGTDKDRNTCIEAKLLLFKKYPDYQQSVAGAVKTEKTGAGEYKCSFVKRVTVNGKIKEYPSYLVFLKKEDGWKITTEGDQVTDHNLAKKKEMTAAPDTAKGDFNGDGTMDSAWLVPPELTGGADDPGCKGDCDSYIWFSVAGMHPLRVKQCIGGMPVSLGDLNNNGTDEIGLLPEWFTSCWSAYYVYTFENGAWIKAVEPFSTHCNQWEQGIIPIEKDPAKEGNVIIRYSEITEEDIVVRTKSVGIK